MELLQSMRQTYESAVEQSDKGRGYKLLKHYPGVDCRPAEIVRCSRFAANGWCNGLDVAGADGPEDEVAGVLLLAH